MADSQNVLSSGIPGLDDVLAGGFTEGRTFVIRGGPGTGKTTIVLQFLLEGIRHNEPCLYIGVGGAGDVICAIAQSHGWLSECRSITVHEVGLPQEGLLAPKRRAFHSADVDLGESVRGILDVLEKVNPKRVVIDTLAELRLICEDDIEYRRQALALRNALAGGGRTVVITDYGGDANTDLHLEALAHGSILLENIAQEFGKERRRLRVMKYRARQVRSGWHDFKISMGKIEVFPSLVASEYHGAHPDSLLSSGNHSLDELLHGGINRGTVTAIIGPSGAGKSSLTAHYVAAAARKGEKSAVYLFDETKQTYVKRSDGMGLSMSGMIESGSVHLRQLDAAEISPGEFLNTVRDQVEKEGVAVVVIDSLNGYVNAMMEERLLLIQLHELFIFLDQKGVSTFLIVAQHGMVGTTMQQQLDVSYLADNIILLRFFEMRGEVRRAISALKKRQGGHELTIREIRYSGNGLELSEPLQQMQGVLTGVPNLARECNAD